MNIINVNIPKSNYSQNETLKKGIVLHITGDSNYNQALNWFKDSDSGVSAHYIIEKNGDVFCCVNPKFKAYHAGSVKNPTAQIYFDNNKNNPNLYMIGIECVSSGEGLTETQNQALIELIIYLSENYNITLDRYHIIGHNELDTIDRIFDPIKSYSVDAILELVKENIDMKDYNLKADEIVELVSSDPEPWKKQLDALEILGTRNVDTLTLEECVSLIKALAPGEWTRTLIEKIWKFK